MTTIATSPTRTAVSHLTRITNQSRPIPGLIGADKNMPMLNTCFQAGRIRQATPQQRQAAAEILTAHLLMVEIMMSNIVQSYVCKVHTQLEERGMLRHNLKRQARQLQTVSFDLQSRCNAHDRAQVSLFCRPIFPSLADAYIQSGGTLTMKLQAQFYKLHNARLSQIYFATKNAIDRACIPQSDLAANVQMVAMLSYTGIEFYDLMCLKADKLMEGFGRITRVKSHHNEKMLCSAKELLRTLCAGKELPQKESEDARTLAAHFQRELTSESLLQLIESSIRSLQMDYTEFVIATLRLKMQEGALPITDVRALVARVGTISNVRRLLKEIAAIALPEGADWDVIDLAQSLPDSSEGSAIADFRHLCFNDHILTPEKEDERTVRLRELRQEARQNNGALPMGTLKHLYEQMGTKKAVEELLKEGGPELVRTVKEWKMVRVKGWNEK